MGFIAKNNDSKDAHINQVRWSVNGNIFASCSKGGSIRLYDGRSMEVVNALHNAHGGKAVTSIQFSNNCKYLLSAGYDDVIRLIDLRVGKECNKYKNCKNEFKKGEICKNQACFSYNDEHIISYSNVSNRLFVYDTNSAQRITKFKEHTSGDSKNSITCVATSPTEPAFMCASSNDNKNRFYATIKEIPQYMD